MSYTNDEDDKRLRATEKMCYHCFEVLVDELEGSTVKKGWPSFRRSKSLSSDFSSDLPHPAVECPLFVTWDKQRPSGSSAFSGNWLGGKSGNQQPVVYELRGCIGSLSPKPLMTAIGEYALTSALKDRRFRPITAEEISQLRVAVSLLVNYEACDHCLDWTVGTHGILIRFLSPSNAREFSATYLPEVADEQHWDQRTAVISLMRKAGYAGNVDDGLLEQVDCTRYQSSKLCMPFEDYRILRNQKEQRRSSGGDGGGAATLVPTEPSSVSSSFNQTTQDGERAQENRNL